MSAAGNSISRACASNLSKNSHKPGQRRNREWHRPGTRAKRVGHLSACPTRFARVPFRSAIQRPRELTSLEHQLQTKLTNPGIARAADSAEASAVDVHSRVIKLDLIQSVVELHPELKFRCLSECTNREILEHAQ